MDYIRTSTIAEPRPATFESTRAAVRPKTWNEESRSCEAIITSESKVSVFDYGSGKVVDEILLANGADVPETFPILADHDRSIHSVIGTAINARREGNVWVATLGFADTPDANEIVAKVRDGHLRSVSIGYRLSEWHVISPGRTETIMGRVFVNESDVPLRVVTRWSIHEVSVVVIPADPNAQIRANSQFHERNHSMPAIHSHNSVTDRPSVGALISAGAIAGGISDPSQCRARIEPGGVLCRIAPDNTAERDAEAGVHLSHLEPIQLLRRAAELDGVRFDEVNPAPYTILRAVESHYDRGLSTLNIDALFSDIFATSFLAGYDEAGDSTEGWCSEHENLALREESRLHVGGVRLTIQSQRGTEAQHLYYTAFGEKTKLACYTGQIRIGEEDLLDETARNLLTHVPQQLGQGARALRPDLAYSILLGSSKMRDNVNLFHADHKNLKTSAGLADTTLGAAMALISQQRHDGIPLGLRARYLIVPTTLERLALKLAKEIFVDDGESARPPIVRSDQRLDDGIADPSDGTGETVLAGSTTDWYLSTAGQHGIKVQTLAGLNKLPQIRRFTLTQGKWGVGFDIRHFVAAKALDWRGLAKSEADA